MNTSRPLASRFTFDPAGDFGGVWSADASRVAFCSMRTGLGDVYVADTSAPANVRRITSLSDQVLPTCWTRDGAWILTERYTKADVDIWMFPTGGGEGKPYLATQFVEGAAELSPDNTLVAYTSNESGRTEVYVEQFPSHAARRQVSAAGGSMPRWRGDGKELFFIAPGGSLMSVDMTSDSATPVALFQLPGISYDVTRDGQRFLVDQPVDDNSRSPMTFVSNWLAERK